MVNIKICFFNLKDDEDFEEPSLAIEEIRSPLRDEDIVSQMETIEMSSVSSNEESSSGSGASSASGSGSGENSNHSSARAHSIGLVKEWVKKIPKNEFSLAYIPHRSLLELRGLRTKKRKRNTTKQSIITWPPSPHLLPSDMKN